MASAQTLPAVAPYAPTSFGDVAKYLNPDGSFYVYFDTEKWGTKLDGFIEQMHQLLVAAIPDEEQKQTTEVVFQLLGGAVKDSGLHAVRGVGMSSVPESAGFYYNRVAVVHGQPGPPQGLYWDMFVDGNAPFAFLDSVPQDAVLAIYSPFKPKAGWDWVKRAVVDTGYEPVAASLNQWVMGLRGMGVDVDQWIESVGPRMGLVVTVSRDQTALLPLPAGGKLEIPQMAAAVAFEVKDDTIFQFVDAMLQPVPNVTRFDDADLRMRSVQVPVPVPINVKPTIARMGPYLILASNDEIVKTMDACRHGERSTLRADAEFQALSKDLPAEGIGFSFLSQRFGETIAAIMQGTMAADPNARPVAALMGALQRQQSSYGVSLRMPDGVVGISRTDFEIGETLVTQAAVMPVALMAGMTLPALGKARGRAREISDMSNLKQIGLALIMFSQDHEDRLPADLGETWAYVNEGKVYVCPAGRTPPPQDADQIRAGQCDYLYFVAGQNLGRIQNPSQTPAACTKPGLLPRGVNVLYCDGHVATSMVVDAGLKALIDAAQRPPQ